MRSYSAVRLLFDRSGRVADVLAFLATRFRRSKFVVGSLEWRHLIGRLTLHAQDPLNCDSQVVAMTVISDKEFKRSNRSSIRDWIIDRLSRQQVQKILDLDKPHKISVWGRLSILDSLVADMRSADLPSKCYASNHRLPRPASKGLSDPKTTRYP